MPGIRTSGYYPDDWSEIATQVKDQAGWRCVRCDHPHDTEAGYMLTVHHLDGNKSNCRWWNLLALCQRCHLRIQHTVFLDRPWVMLPHSLWFRPYIAGFYAWKYLGQDLPRETIEANLNTYLGLEREAYGLPPLVMLEM